MMDEWIVLWTKNWKLDGCRLVPDFTLCAPGHMNDPLIVACPQWVACPKWLNCCTTLIFDKFAQFLRSLRWNRGSELAMGSRGLGTRNNWNIELNRLGLRIYFLSLWLPLVVFGPPSSPFGARLAALDIWLDFNNNWISFPSKWPRVVSLRTPGI